METEYRDTRFAPDSDDILNHDPGLAQHFCFMLIFVQCSGLRFSLWANHKLFNLNLRVLIISMVIVSRCWSCWRWRGHGASSSPWALPAPQGSLTPSFGTRSTTRRRWCPMSPAMATLTLTTWTMYFQNWRHRVWRRTAWNETLRAKGLKVQACETDHSICCRSNKTWRKGKTRVTMFGERFGCMRMCKGWRQLPSSQSRILTHTWGHWLCGHLYIHHIVRQL